MSRADRASEHAPASGRLWATRLFVLAALGLTLWFAGPKAWRIASAELRSEAADGEPVDIARLKKLRAPGWLHGASLRSFLRDLEPRLRGEVRMLDDERARELIEVLESSPWVRDLQFERRFPDRFRVSFDLRRPACALYHDERQVGLLDDEGVLLPDHGEASVLPIVRLDRQLPPLPQEFGRSSKDARARAAVRVAVEWRDRIAPELADPPALVEVDARNLGWNLVPDPRISQVVVLLRRQDGREAGFHYGRAADDKGPIDVPSRVALLKEILREHPGLGKIDHGDLRKPNTWRDALRPLDLANPDAERGG